mmetsp:Transcript_10291/g.15047  ORF Transcript_10291/g.15047 Transcript_10291/m.15047 type:complete len:326 (+) Transcript_10291:69-1046(+)
MSQLSSTDFEDDPASSSSDIGDSDFPTTKPHLSTIDDSQDNSQKNSLVDQINKLPGVVSGAQKRFTKTLNVQTYEILKTITKPMSKNELNKSSAKMKKQRINEEPPFLVNGFLTPYSRRTMPSRVDLSFKEAVDVYIKRPQREAQYAAKLAVRKGKLSIVRPLPGSILGDPGFGLLQLPRRLTPKVSFVHENGRGKKMSAYVAAHAKRGFPTPSRMDPSIILDEIEHTQMEMNRRLHSQEADIQRRLRRLMAKRRRSKQTLTGSDILSKIVAPPTVEDPIVVDPLLSPIHGTPAPDSANSSLVAVSDTSLVVDDSDDDDDKVLFQ